ncbi:Aste57867_6940 [Aphanomyces stellatus]|uniref:Aste57867_6940 protein n=1 Tax=Aphanomyces stellatus TaxID=120398 RepID=A0A485KG56_9STRA|nr:hypothetical protein As57867_006918 [Aphanomyces stellatus]VFT83892.1 Aste57867_6940 [Aphanomyces stellatus]
MAEEGLPRRPHFLGKLLALVLVFFFVQFTVLTWYFGVKFEDIRGRIFRADEVRERTDHHVSSTSPRIVPNESPSTAPPSQDSSFVRAAVIFASRSADHDRFLQEFRWFHRSWVHMRRSEPASWRTDIVVFSDGPRHDLDAFGCTTTPRATRAVSSRCVLVDDYVPLATPVNTMADSIHVAAQDISAMRVYDYVLRTDIDTFFTPDFATWQPPTLVVSAGAYSYTATNVARLARITDAMKFHHANLTNVGLTWYGPTHVVRACAQATTQAMQYLDAHAFTAEEKSAAYGNQGWPEWHYGVLASYAGHVALNHCTYGLAGGAHKTDTMLEFSTAESNETPLAGHAHLRAGQGDARFSKYQFFYGTYANESIAALDLEIVSEYAMAMALAAQPTPKPTATTDSAHLNKPFLRAAVVFMPLKDREAFFLKQFRWFRRSWMEIQTHEPAAWRTDLVVFSTGTIRTLELLGCTTTPRQTPRDPNQCILVTNYTLLRTDDFDYAFGDSINVVAQDVAALEPYDWLLRTDIDVFLTPAFATWRPNEMVIGRGAYETVANYVRLEAIARDVLGWNTSKLHNVGSTWFGPAAQVRACAKWTVRAMQHFHEHEFTDEEKSAAYGNTGWPEWHYGVLSLYAGHVAINHCMHGLAVDKDERLLDFPTASDEPTSDHPHLHAWQNRLRFSKFAFDEGQYAGESLTALDLTKVSDYAMYMALDSQQSADEPTTSVAASLNEPFVRAAVVFMPHKDREAFFLKQFRWFRRSWMEIQTHEPAAWRTDLVVFSTGTIRTLELLGCTTTPRQTPRDPNQCILVTNYTLLRTDDFDYAFGDSINVVAQDVAALEPYDWLLRTDVDVFLTPAFATWRPNEMVIGRGAYETETNAPRLERISRDLGWTSSKNLRNVGSTWYGPATIVRTCAKLTIDAMKYLHEHEFTAEEKSVAYGNQGWPNWHYGVLSLYAGHLAINQCTDGVPVVKNETLLDFPTTSDEPTSDHPHLHTWQNRRRFSKMMFDEGQYANESLAALDVTKVSDYAMYMALDSQPTVQPRPPTDPAAWNEPFVRAAVLYLPQTGRELHFHWFWRSWEIMQTFEPAAWRTDLVVITTAEAPWLALLGCTTTPRQSIRDPNRCIVVANYTQLQASSDFGFGFGDSIHAAAQDLMLLDAYDWLLRTEVDAMLTPAFATWKPPVFVLGGAAYETDANVYRLERIIVDLAWTTSDLRNVGTTWYGPAALVRACAKLTVRAMLYLDANEFTADEKSDAYGAAGWPEWHYGVLDQYATHVAINHCTRGVDVYKDEGMLYFYSDSDDVVTTHAHLQAWPDKATRGTDMTSTPSSSMDAWTVREYARYVALESHEGRPIMPVPPLPPVA